jgi:predicted TIM-barrel fold metal-dependent hydrolase
MRRCRDGKDARRTRALTVCGFDIIDTHHHVGTLEALGLTGPASPGEDDHGRLEVETRLAAMDRLGVDQAVVIPGHGYLRPNGLQDTRRINDEIAMYRDRMPERFPAAVGIVEPLYGPAGLDELDRIAADLRLVGVSFHVRFQGVSTDSPLVTALVRRIAELGLVPFVHAVSGVPDEALWQVQELARGIPDTTVVVLDGFSSFEQSRQVLPVADATPNLVFDTSLSYTFTFIEQLVGHVGADRVVFGTDHYSGARGPERNHLLDELLASGLPDGAKRAILADNIRSVLRLPTAL